MVYAERPGAARCRFIGQAELANSQTRSTTEVQKIRTVYWFIQPDEPPISRSDRATGVSERPFEAIGATGEAIVTIRIPVGQPLIWNEAAIALLGKQSDRAVAKLLGVNPKTAQAKRRALGIPPYRLPKRVLTITCVIATCGKKTQVTGRRASTLRVTCLPPHWVTRPRSMSACQRELISQTLLARQGTSPSLKKIRATPGMRFIGFDAG